MKFAEAIKAVKTSKNFQGELSFLSSYNPFIFTTYLQADLIQNSNNGPTYKVKNSEYDSLLRSLEEDKLENKKYSPSILSLVWEDFIPSVGWRARTNSIDHWSFDQPAVSILKNAILEWVKERSKAGATSFVILPPSSWLLPFLGNESLLTHSFQAELMIWKGELAKALLQESAFIINAEPRNFNLREFLNSGCPWSLEEAERIAAKVAYLIRPPRETIKGIIVDLDNTLWKGVIEDDSAVNFANEEWTNRPFHVFSKILLEYKKSGLFLACCSKNDFKDVKKYIKKLNPVIAFEDFNSVAISWNPKSEGVRSICKEINILPSNILFIDDNPAEILEVQNNFPEIVCLQTPSDKNGWLSFYEELQKLCFLPRVLTEEDMIRAMDHHAMERRLLQETTGSSRKEYLKSLDLKLIVQQGQWKERRTLDLMNKTNQFSLNGNRFTMEQLVVTEKKENSWCLTGRLLDMYGDFGVVGVMWGTNFQNTTVVEAMAVSCRAFDRHMEYALLQVLLRLQGCHSLSFMAKETARNQMTGKYLKTLGLSWGSTEIIDIPQLLSFLEEKVIEVGMQVEIQ